MHLHNFNFLFVFLQPRNPRIGRTLRNAGARRALCYSVDRNDDESEESDCLPPPKLSEISSSEDTEDEDECASTWSEADGRRAVR